MSSNISNDLQILAIKVQKAVLSSKGGEMSDAEFNKLKSSYKKIKNKYRYFDTESIQNELSEEDLTLFHYFELGFDQETATYKSVLKGITNHQGQAQFDAHLFLQEFFKYEGYRNIHQSKYSDLNQKDQEYIRSIFGGVLGVDILDECMASVRLEQLADLWMYVASKNHLDDIKEYHLQSANPQFKAMYETVGHYLVEQLSKRKKTVIYRVDENNGTSAAVIDSQTKNFFECDLVAGAYRSDSCYINDKTKEIYICSASLHTDISNKSQLSTLAKMCHALQLTLENTDLQTTYHGYTIKSHILHGGFFPITHLIGNQNKSKFDGKALVETLGWSQWDATLQNKAVDVFSLYPILFYLSEQNPSPYVSEILLNSNLASLGCDTFGFYQRSREIKNTQYPLKNFSLDILHHLNCAVDFLNNEEVCVSIHGDGKVKLATYLKAVSKSVANYMYNFPPHIVGNNNEYDEKHVQQLLQLAGNCKNLIQKIKTDEQNFDGSGITKDLHAAYLSIKNLENISDSIEALPSQSRMYTHDKTEEMRLVKKYDIQSTLSEKEKGDLLLNISENLSKGLATRNDFSYLAAMRDSGIFGTPPTAVNNIIENLVKYNANEPYDKLCGYSDPAKLRKSLISGIKNHKSLWRSIIQPLIPLFDGAAFESTEFKANLITILKKGRETKDEKELRLNSMSSDNVEKHSAFAISCFEHGSYITGISFYLNHIITKKRHPIYEQIRDSAKPPSQKKASRKKQ